MKKLIALFKEENFDEIEKLIVDQQDYVSSAITKMEHVKWICKRNAGSLRKVALLKAPYLVKTFEDCKWLYPLALAETKLIILGSAEEFAKSVPQLLWVYERSDLSQRDSLLSKIELKMTNFSICHDVHARSSDETIKNLAIRKATSLAVTPANVIWIAENSPGRIKPELLLKLNEALKSFKDCKYLFKKSGNITLRNIAILAAKKMASKFNHYKWLYKRLKGTDKLRFLQGTDINYAEELYDFVWVYKKARKHEDPILEEKMIEKIKLLMISFSEAKYLYENTEGPLRDYGFARAKNVTANFDALLRVYINGDSEFGKLYKTKLQESFITYEQYETMLVLCDGVMGICAREKINKILWG